MIDVAEIDGIVCDLDGVVYRGDEPIPGAVEAISSLRRRGVQVVFCTNNSGWTVAQYVAKLASLGVEAGPDDILTSAIVTAEVLKQRGCSGRAGSSWAVPGSEALESIGVVIDSDPDSLVADLVVVGWDPSFDYAAMRRAAMAVRSGATLVASNDDASWPAPDGLWPGAGAILASIEKASGGIAEVMGKPHRPMMEAAASRLEGAKHVAVVGDRPDTDLAGGLAMGWGTILVLSGVTTAEETARLRPEPDLILSSLADLVS